MKGTESFKQTIHSYLEQRASEDALFAEKYHAVNRSIDDIVTYILNEYPQRSDEERVPRLR